MHEDTSLLKDMLNSLLLGATTEKGRLTDIDLVYVAPLLTQMYHVGAGDTLYPIGGTYVPSGRR